MKKLQKSDGIRTKLTGFLGNLLFGIFTLSMVMVATLIVTTSGAVSASAEESPQPFVDLDAIADKAKTGWEDLKNDLKEKADSVIDKIPAVGDLVQIDNSMGDRSYSFSLIDGLVTDIELKVGGDISALEAEVAQLEQTIDSQNERIMEQENEINRLKNKVSSLFWTFAAVSLACIVAVERRTNKRCDDIERLLNGYMSRPDNQNDGKSPVNLSKDHRPHEP